MSSITRLSKDDRGGLVNHVVKCATKGAVTAPMSQTERRLYVFMLSLCRRLMNTEGTHIDRLLRVLDAEADRLHSKALDGMVAESRANELAPLAEIGAKFRRRRTTVDRAREFIRLRAEGKKAPAAAKLVGWTADTARRTVARLRAVGLLPKTGQVECPA